LYATIRRYEGVTGRTEDLTEAMREITAGLSRTPAFVSFVMIEAETGVVITLGIFEDQGSLNEADLMIGASLPKDLSELIAERAQVTTGEIIFQRGL